MSKPPENLMDWPKAELAREVARLRAVTREHAEQVRSDSPEPNGAPIMGGSPHGRGDALLDIRGAVLLDSSEVVLVDREPGAESLPTVMLVLGGRVNYSTRRSQSAYLFDTDGAAAIVTELLGLAARAGDEFLAAFERDFDRRMDALP